MTCFSSLEYRNKVFIVAQLLLKFLESVDYICSTSCIKTQYWADFCVSHCTLNLHFLFYAERGTECSLRMDRLFNEQLIFSGCSFFQCSLLWWDNPYTYLNFVLFWVEAYAHILLKYPKAYSCISLENILFHKGIRIAFTPFFSGSFRNFYALICVEQRVRKH